MSSSRRVVLASHNAGKLSELQTQLSQLNLELVCVPGPASAAPEETGGTFVENALIKARVAARATGLPAIADDSGICVDALGGAPGIHSARFAGSGADDDANNRLLLARLQGVAGAARGASFVCVLVYLRAADDPLPLIATGTWRGVVLDAPRGEGGFGYDPLFGVSAAGPSAAQLPPARKHALSHRGHACAALRTLLIAEFAR